MSIRTPSSRSSRHPRRGFTLVEVLMAIIILGIGMISIAAIFPAGIAQQRQSSDDVMGSIVAENALSLIRTKVDASQFGTYEPLDPSYVSSTITGDWPWRRPAFYRTNHGVTVNGNSFTIAQGSIAIFNPTGGYAPGGGYPTDNIPWNTALYGTTPPPVPTIITQRERFYPTATTFASNDVVRPQYAWECMFRRFGGRIFVAIFVYRVNTGGQGGYTVAVPPGDVPPLPVSIDLVNTPGGYSWANQPWFAAGDTTNPTWNNKDDGRIPGTFPGDAYDPLSASEGWQIDGQWILDQNNNIHRVLNGRRIATDGPVELARPVPPLPALPVFEGAIPSGGGPAQNAVKYFWYIPPVDANGVELTPVYVTVREL